MNILEKFEFKNNRAVWLYNINQEQDWNESKIWPSITDKKQLELVYQQEQQLLLLARPDDAVLFSHSPDPNFLEYLKEQGIKLPRIIYRPVDNKIPWEELGEGNNVLVPYIISEFIEKTSKLKGIKVYGSRLALVKMLNNKLCCRKIAEENGFNVTEGFFCSTISELKIAYQKLQNLGFKKVVLKIPFGSSGKGIKVIENERSFITFLKFISRYSKEFEILLEGWHDICVSLNTQLLVQDNGVEVIAVTEQKIDRNGMYLGTNFSPNFESTLLERYIKEMYRIGDILKELGYKGIVGIDSILDTKGNLIPIIEINARMTQVTYLLPMVNRLRGNYSKIFSGFYRFQSSNELTFNDIYLKIYDQLKPDNDNTFFIYTFAKHRDQSKNYYRIFVMFYGNNEEKLSKMYEKARFLENEYKNFDN
ncbi:ATP-grasp domain-containing protein [Bacillus cereus]|nr:ATP-grasp domain-containing protein [Bacillus cereus]